MSSIFREELYDPTELSYLNLAVESEQLESLTSIVGTHSEMTREKEKDIARVLSILRPPKIVPNYRARYEEALKSKEQKTDYPAVVLDVEKKKLGRPKKIVEPSLDISITPVGA